MTEPLLPYEIEVPEKLVNHIRVYIGDSREFNRILEGIETSDEKLKMAVQLWIQHFNAHPPVLCRKYIATDFPNYLLMFQGVMIQVLIMAGIIQTRNFLNFNDGGVSFVVSDKGQEYSAWINNLMMTHREDFMNTKMALNAEAAYGIHPSPDGFYRNRGYW